MSTPYWHKASRAWNHPTLAGRFLPGRVKLKNAGRKLRYDAHKTSGSDGGGVTIKGLEPRKFTFEIEIVTEEDHDAWDRLVPLIEPMKDPKARGPVSVYHPSLARYGIQACQVVEIEEEPPEAGGPLKCKIECLAVTPKKPGATKKATSKNAPPPPTPTTPFGQAPQVNRSITERVTPPPPKLTKGS